MDFNHFVARCNMAFGAVYPNEIPDWAVELWHRVEYDYEGAAAFDAMLVYMADQQQTIIDYQTAGAAAPVPAAENTVDVAGGSTEVFAAEDNAGLAADEQAEQVVTPAIPFLPVPPAPMTVIPVVPVVVAAAATATTTTTHNQSATTFSTARRGRDQARQKFVRENAGVDPYSAANTREVYVCAVAGCPVARFRSNEMSRHYGDNPPPGHNHGVRPPPTFKVWQRDWFADEGLAATAAATCVGEFTALLADQ